MRAILLDDVGSWEQFICTREDNAVILNAGATANLVCSWRLNHHNSPSEKVGLPRVPTYPAQARFKFGDGRMGDVKFAAEITAGVAGAKPSGPNEPLCA